VKLESYHKGTQIIFISDSILLKRQSIVNQPNNR